MENEALVLDLLEWLAGGPRAYEDVMAAWRTSCPRLTIWEDAVDATFVRIESGGKGAARVFLTSRGFEFLRAQRPDRRGPVGRAPDVTHS